MKQYKIALFIGRFQPFHNGHLYSLKKCLEIADKVIVGIGSSETSGTRDNPWDYKIRRRMVRAIDQTVRIVAIPDTPTDEEWVREVEKSAGEFDVVVSNNEWTLKVMKEAGYATFETGLYKREELEGVKIREMMRAGDERWRERVPQEVVNILLTRGREN